MTTTRTTPHGGVLDLDRFWVLTTEGTAYALGFDELGQLVNTYWGPPLPRAEDYPRPSAPQGWSSFNHPSNLSALEYPTPSGPYYGEQAVQLSFASGQRDLNLAFERAEAGEDHLVLHLRDRDLPFRLSLHYRLPAHSQLIERHAELHNLGETDVQLRRAFSASLPLPGGGDYALTHLEGRWFDEFRIRRERFVHGNLTCESRRLTTGHDGTPGFFVDLTDPDLAASEERGDVWFGTLAWSGNWKLIAERSRFGHSALHLGVNDHDFGWTLRGGETFATPPVLFGFTRGGYGAASRELHRYARRDLLPHGEAPHPVLYNSWEVTQFDVTEASQMQLAEAAARLGVELFVVDDGWFAGRVSDTAGLGNWWPDPVKFPRGLTPLIEHVQSLGLGFGLWIEPEMVNPDSDLYRAHPDWVIHFAGRESSLMRDQLILNLAREDVQDHLIRTFDLFLRGHDIAFIKWDMNRSVSEPGWPNAPGDRRELWVRYVQGLYRVWGTLRERHPEVLWQTCSGGGGRLDFGMLRLADQAWPSDNTEATARLEIQEGYSLTFPAIAMETFVTDRRAHLLPLRFRFHVAMCGALGLGGHILDWTPEEREQATELVAQYKQIRPLVQRGDLFRLRSPSRHAYSARLYLAKDRAEGVLFAFHTHSARVQDPPTLSLPGLDPAAMYEVEGCGKRSGAAWHEVGLRLPLGEFESTVRRIWRRA